jgi:hypothetical protein
MKKISFLFLITGFVIAALGQKTINDPNAQKRAVSDYHGVAVSGSIELFLTQGNEESVVISADDTKWRDKVVTEVRDGILHIYLDSKNRLQFDWSLHPKRLRAYVSVKDIDYLSSSGSGKTHIEDGLKAEKLKVDISGSGNVDGKLLVKDLNLGLSGSANADLSGNAENSDLHISGSGNIRSYDFTTAFCKASISGSGNVRITVTKELSAHISGSGNVSIKGDGLIRDYSASGSGKFTRVH